MRFLTILMLGVGLLLGGCDRTDVAPGTEVTPDAGAVGERSAKLYIYAAVLAWNGMHGPFDPAAEMRRYEDYDIPNAAPDTKVALHSNLLETTLDELKRARAESGDLPKVDAAADQAIPALERLAARARALDSYYTTRGPLADGFERGRRGHEALLADYQAAKAGWKPLKAAYEEARDDNLARSAALYRQEGRMAAYYDVVMVQKAVTLTRTIDTPEAAADPKRAAEAERIVGDLLSLIERGRAASAAEPSQTAPMIPDEAVRETLETMIGAWRDLRSSRDAYDQDRFHEAMTRNVDNAVQTLLATQ